MSVALLASVLVFTATPSPVPVVLPQLLAGKLRLEESGLYLFRTDGTWECRVADMIDAGRWKLRNGHTLELIAEHFRSKPTREIIVIDRVVHETLYVRTRFGREVWLKQPGP